MSFLETGFILPSRGAQPPGDLFSQALTPACIRRAVSSLFKQSPPVSSRGAQRRGDLFSQAILLPHPASEEQSAADSNSLRLCHRERAARGDLNAFVHTEWHKITRGDRNKENKLAAASYISRTHRGYRIPGQFSVR